MPDLNFEEVAFFQDGDMWCCVRPGFENLAESPAGFGHTKGAAYDDLCENEEK